MSSSDALLQHIVKRMQADIDFLVTQGVLSATDGQLMTSKLPSSQAAVPRQVPTPMVSPSPSPLPSALPRVSSAGRDVTPSSSSSKTQAVAIWAYDTQVSQFNINAFFLSKY
jgi:hypothetical protein